MAQSSDFPCKSLSTPNIRCSFLNLGSRFGIPPEIALEIAAHNADDVTSLRAMSLVSRSMRSLAIEHLFSVVHFACAQDLSWWQTMLCRTPELATFVKKVKFSDASEDWIKRHRKVRYPQSLYVACLEPKFTAMPNVCAVEWDTCSINIWMAVAYMALFPNLKELHLRGINLHGFHELRQFLHACGRLQVLSFSNTIVAKNEWDEELPDPQWTNPDDDNSTTEDWVDDGSKLENRQQVSFPSDLKGWLHWFCEGPTRPVVPPLPLTFDLTALEELAVMDCGDQEHGYFGRLVEKSQPTGLRSLTFAGNCRGHDSCPIPDAEKLLRLATKTLVSLTVDPTFIVDSGAQPSHPLEYF
ncbi:hypothetical protein B0H19DRAFT_677984 [Mycena capillaripes]|nr:hypothetical protein B0H19DRAFT_677984 [Mycena capillaripes]